MKKLQNNYTTPEQSKRLLELGVPADSADCYTTTNNGRAVVLNLLFSEFMENIIAGGLNNPHAYLPCWSVGRLMEIYDICNDGSDDGDWLPYNNVKGSYVAYVIGAISGAKRCEQIDFSKLDD